MGSHIWEPSGATLLAWCKELQWHWIGDPKRRDGTYRRWEPVQWWTCQPAPRTWTWCERPQGASEARLGEVHRGNARADWISDALRHFESNVTESAAVLTGRLQALNLNHLSKTSKIKTKLLQFSLWMKFSMKKPPERSHCLFKARV